MRVACSHRPLRASIPGQNRLWHLSISFAACVDEDPRDNYAEGSRDFCTWRCATMASRPMAAPAAAWRACLLTRDHSAINQQQVHVQLRRASSSAPGIPVARTASPASANSSAIWKRSTAFADRSADGPPRDRERALAVARRAGSTTTTGSQSCRKSSAPQRHRQYHRQLNTADPDHRGY